MDRFPESNEGAARCFVGNSLAKPVGQFGDPIPFLCQLPGKRIVRDVLK